MRRVSSTDATVLILGETGTGKELIARGIHALSKRASRPFIAANCSAIPDTLIESELFGYHKGAFTGAVTNQVGLFQQADTGTVFLDEIGEMSALAQAKILRALEAHEIQPLGTRKPIQVDIRVIAATHRDLSDSTSQNCFRRDLFYRLNVIPIQVPPLRDRRDDIPDLIQRFVQDLNNHYGRSVEGISPGALEMLCGEDWPGNIRQLRNVIEAAFVLTTDGRITEEGLRDLNWNKVRVDNRMIATNTSR